MRPYIKYIIPILIPFIILVMYSNGLCCFQVTIDDKVQLLVGVRTTRDNNITSDGLSFPILRQLDVEVWGIYRLVAACF